MFKIHNDPILLIEIILRCSLVLEELAVILSLYSA